MEVEFFDSHEAAAKRLRQAMEAADARVAPWQAALRPGECILSIVEDGLVVFGEVLEGYREPHLKHYRFCRCFSVACPAGELGDMHVSTVACRISRPFFEQMRQAGWAMEGPPPAWRTGSQAHRGAAEMVAPPTYRVGGTHKGLPPARRTQAAAVAAAKSRRDAYASTFCFSP